MNSAMTTLLAEAGSSMIAPFDIFLIVLALLSIWIGWRQGAVASLLSILGIVAGLVVGLALAPYAMDLVESENAKLLLGLGAVILLVSIGHMVGAMTGQSIRNVIRSRMAVGVDSGLGAVVQTLTATLLVWMIALPLASVVPGTLGNAVRESKGLSIIDRYAPQQLSGALSDIMRRLRDNGMPAIAPNFGQVVPQPDTPADPNVVSQAVVDEIRPSIVRVLGEAPQCERLTQGTGFMVAPDLILTNAHVVAGVETVRLETVLGMADANVVHYDPRDDVALLRTTDLQLPVVEWVNNDAVPGDGAVVLGFPESGPFTATPARVDSELVIRGPDIYSQERLEREAYVLKSDVRHGNSGGPLITPDGKILGLVFGAGVNNDQTGYALTKDETMPHIDAAREEYSPVSTQECVA